MNEVKPVVSWVEANQAFLVAEFDDLKRRLRGDPGEGPGKRAAVDATMADHPPAVDQLTSLFGLSAFERGVLLLCAGVEMDSEIASLCGAAQGNPNRPTATFGVAISTLPDPHWSALTPSRPLRRFRLVELEAGRGVTSGSIRIDERILHFLAGVNQIDSRLEGIVAPGSFPAWIAKEHRSAADQVKTILETHRENAPVLHLSGDDPLGQEDVAAKATHDVGLGLFTVSAEDLPPAGPDLDQFLILWQREALVLPAALLIQCGSNGPTASARHLAERLQGPLFLASSDPVRLTRSFLRFDVNKPLPTEQKRLWKEALGQRAHRLNGALDDLAEQFRLSAHTIYTTSSLVGSPDAAVSGGELWNICRSLSRPRLENLAQRLVPFASWDDLVLPEFQTQTLRALASQVRHRMKVYETWGFSAKGRRGLGVSALFTGESGTGKTLAAEVLARELQLDLYRIDLSAVVSKYIGETEKNLKLVFDAAEDGGVLLLFDEADALFGKRADVKDSHDRYANIEVGYLLQRMEAYQGLAILTTNLKSSLDHAFQRRLRFIVNFPFPDAAQREAIWSRVFPSATPTRGLDPKRLAQLNMAGGNIRNIALNSAFLAAEAKSPVAMSHVLQAAQAEANKIERVLSEAEIRGWV